MRRRQFRTPASRRPSTPAIAAAAMITILLLVACGSGTPSNPPTDGRAQTRAQLSFSACMRSHGVPNFPDPGAEWKSAFNPQSPAFVAGNRICGHLLSGPGQPHHTPAHTQQQVAAIMTFARCMRTHGFPTFPDPMANGVITGQMIARARIDPNQPAILRAGDACVNVTHGVLTTIDVARAVQGSKNDATGGG